MNAGVLHITVGLIAQIIRRETVCDIAFPANILIDSTV